MKKLKKTQSMPSFKEQRARRAENPSSNRGLWALLLCSSETLRWLCCASNRTIGATVVPCGTGEWLARVDHIRWWKLAIGDWQSHPSKLQVMPCLAPIGKRQTRGEGIVQGNGRPKGCFWRVLSSLPPSKVCS